MQILPFSAAVKGLGQPLCGRRLHGTMDYSDALRTVNYNDALKKAKNILLSKRSVSDSSISFAPYRIVCYGLEWVRTVPDGWHRNAELCVLGVEKICYSKFDIN